MSPRRYTWDSASNRLKRNAVSFTCIIVGLVNIVIQFLMPDAVPSLIIKQILTTADSAMVALYTIFLYLWIFGGFALVLCGLVVIIVKGFRS
jgi:hypothetical protein